jgi:predicted RNase H-like HicB family nuclease
MGGQPDDYSSAIGGPSHAGQILLPDFIHVEFLSGGQHLAARWQGESLPGAPGTCGYPEIQDGRPGVMLNYEIILYWSQEDGVFIAEVPELPGCMAHGDTQEAALANVKEAMQLWLDTAREFGDPVPEPRGRRLIYA